MTGQPISVVVWRDAASDPPHAFEHRVLVQAANGSIMLVRHDDGQFVAEARGLPIVLQGVRRWAPLPALNENGATTEDLREILDYLEYDYGVPTTLQPNVARLRALLPEAER